MANILTLDDSQLTRKMIRRILEEDGHTVTQVEDAIRGLKLFENQSGFDLILTDFNMPGMNGVEFIRAIRKTGSLIPIYVLTTMSDESLQEEGRKAGATGWVLKPPTSKRIRQIIGSI